MRSIQGKISFRILNGSVLALFIFTVLYYTAGTNSIFLWKLQDLDLFIATPQFFLHSISNIGGSTVYVSSFLNHFFYQPWTGSIIYLLVLLVVAWLTSTALDLKGGKSALAFIPSLALLLLMTQLGYMIYTLKMDGFVYVGAIGLISVLCGLILFKKMKRILIQSMFIILYLLIIVPISGAYAIFGAILILLYTLKQTVIKKEPMQLIPALTAFICIFLIPFLYYQFVFNQTSFKNVFLINLPAFLLKGGEKMLWIPYLFMALFFIIALLLNKGNATEPKLSFLSKSLPFALFVSCLAGVVSLTYKDKNFDTELSMITASEKGEWNKVLELSKKNQGEPTRLIVMNTQLAMFKLGLSEDIYKIKDGNKAFNSPSEILPIHIAGIFFYYQYGKMNYCYKWCMENMVEFGMSASVMKYFVLSSILNGEYNLARKYNDVLKSTIFHQSWAMDHESYINDPGKIAAAQEFKSLVPLLAYSNSLEGDQNMLEEYLKNSFANIQGDFNALIELSIHSNLNMKNKERFWPKFFQWVKTHKKIPVRFQEAALLFQQIEQKENIDPVVLDKEVVDNFQKFLAFAKKYEGYPNESVQSLYYKQFGGTYWYYFFYAKDHSTAIENQDK